MFKVSLDILDYFFKRVELLFDTENRDGSTYKNLYSEINQISQSNSDLHESIKRGIQTLKD